MRKMKIVFHCNPVQKHQKEHALWLREGFKHHGLNLIITQDIQHPADIHIVSGPHYCKKQWQGHPRVILLDRAYYRDGPKPDGMVSMPYVSLGWMNEDSNRNFDIGCGRESPTIKDRPDKGGTIFLADFGGPIERADTVRRHPAEERYTEDLISVLRRHRLAIGYKTTALVTAALEGLEVIAKDPGHILNRSNWREQLAYADWHYTEIKSGEAWQHLIRRLS